MNPIEHYREAERILAIGPPTHLHLPDGSEGRPLSWDEAHQQHIAMLAKAQVHATLATVQEPVDILWGDRKT